MYNQSDCGGPEGFVYSWPCYITGKVKHITFYSEQMKSNLNYPIKSIDGHVFYILVYYSFYKYDFFVSVLIEFSI